MEKKNKIGCFILSRMGSSRLPGKALKKIKGKPVIQHVIERAKLMFPSAIVVLCTSTDKSDDILENIARANHIKIFRGSPIDVLSRFLGAARFYKVDHFAVYSGDNIFCDPRLMLSGVKQMLKKKLDFITVPDNLVCGGSAYCISTRALEKVCKDKITDNTEYYPKFFTSRSDFRIEALAVSEPIFYDHEIRLTLDYPEDLKFARKVFNELGTDKNNTPLENILELLHQKPDIPRINILRQKDWSENQKFMKILNPDQNFKKYPKD